MHIYIYKYINKYIYLMHDEGGRRKQARESERHDCAGGGDDGSLFDKKKKRNRCSINPRLKWIIIDSNT